jgi:hypothetical protein
MFIAPVPSQDAGNQPGNKQAEKPIVTIPADKNRRRGTSLAGLRSLAAQPF